MISMKVIAIEVCKEGEAKKMKMKIDGIEVDGSPQELAQFVSEYAKRRENISSGPLEETVKAKPSKVVIVRKDTIYRRRKRRIQPKTKERLQQALEICKKGKSVSYALIKIFGYQTGHHSKQLQKLLKKQGIGFTPQNKGKRKIIQLETANVKDKRVDRMRWIHSRAKSLANTYNYSYERAIIQARQEWSQHGKIEKVVTEEDRKAGTGIPTPDDMPVIIKDPQRNKLLMDILKHMIANGGSMTLPNEGAMLGCDTPDSWRMLVFNTINNGKLICDYYNVPLKFKIDGAETPSRMRLIYEK